jgi:predicted outer membrane protein
MLTRRPPVPGTDPRHRSVGTRLRWFVVTLVSVLFSLVAESPAAQADSDDEPLTAADKELVVKVRLAGLWEMPAGKMAATKGVNPRVREIGSMIATQHAQLNAIVVKAAKELNVPLPSEPNSDQKMWLGEMAAADGDQFDHIFVDRLRAAHGKIFPVIAQVRAGTKNDVVRRLAQSANGFVLMHLTLLESTGIVDWGTIPSPPQPSPTPSPGAASVAGAAVGATTAAGVTSARTDPNAQPESLGEVDPFMALLRSADGFFWATCALLFLVGGAFLTRSGVRRQAERRAAAAEYRAEIRRQTRTRLRDNENRAPEISVDRPLSRAYAVNPDPANTDPDDLYAASQYPGRPPQGLPDNANTWTGPSYR